MNLPDTVVFLTWLSQHDARIQVTDAEVEIWQHTLSVVPTQNVKDATLEFYRLNDDGKPTPHAIRKIAIADRDRALAKQSALTAGPAPVRNAKSFRERNPAEWDAIIIEACDEYRANLRARGITPHVESCPTCRAMAL